MKLFPADWPGFLEELAAWGELSITARRTFLDGITPGLSLASARGEPAIGELWDTGFLTESGSVEHFEVAAGRVQFHQVMKALQKHPLFETPGLAVLCSYLGDHYTQQERSQLHESLALLPNDLPRVAGFVSSVEWLREALARASRPSEATELAIARMTLSFFTEQRDHIAVRDLEEYFPQTAREELCAGVRLGLQRCRLLPRAAPLRPGAPHRHMARGRAPAAEAVGGSRTGAGERRAVLPPSLSHRGHDHAPAGRARGIDSPPARG